MYLTPLLAQELGLIEGLSEREINNPEGVGIDVRAGEIYELIGESLFLDDVKKIEDILELFKLAEMEKEDKFDTEEDRQRHIEYAKTIVSSDCFIESEMFSGKAKRKMPQVKKLADIKDPASPRIIRINPGTYRLIATMEAVNIPGEKIITEKGEKPVYIMQDVRPRSTLQRCGIIFIGTKTDPGYHGKLTYAVYNAGKMNFSIALGARFANLIFCEVRGEIKRPYDGQNQGGRVTSDGKTEKQN